MARVRRAALVLVFAGGLAMSGTASASAGGYETSGAGTDCIVCWPGWG